MKRMCALYGERGITRGNSAARVHAGHRTGSGWKRFVLSSSKAEGLMAARGFIGPYKLKGIA